MFDAADDLETHAAMEAIGLVLTPSLVCYNKSCNGIDTSKPVSCYTFVVARVICISICYLNLGASPKHNEQ